MFSLVLMDKALILVRGMSTCFPLLQYRSDTTKADVNANGSRVQTAAGEHPPKSIQTENYSTAVYEVLLPVTDIANHTAIQLKGTEKQIAIKGIHVRNGFTPYYLLPRERREIHLKLGLTMRKNG